VFVVFDQATSQNGFKVPTVSTKTVATIKGPWKVDFPPNLGAPKEIKLNKLISWTKDKNKGVKYFSGTAIYTNSFRILPKWIYGSSKILLDLGKVKDIAQVSINGKDLGILWKPPFQVNIKDVLKPGLNEMRIKITNEWTNRLAGDRLAPQNKKILSGTIPHFGGPQKLSESGLLGPVEIKLVTNVSNKP
jgi:hypothetical protein